MQQPSDSDRQEQDLTSLSKETTISSTDPMTSMREALERKLAAKQGKQGKGPGQGKASGGSRVGKGRPGSNGGPLGRRSGHR